MAFEITDQNFEKEVLKSSIPVFIDFWATWCGPCRQVAHIIEELAKEYDQRVLIGRMNVDENPEYTVKHNIRNIPTFIIYKDGEVIKKHVGALSLEQFKKMIEDSLKVTKESVQG